MNLPKFTKRSPKFKKSPKFLVQFRKKYFILKLVISDVGLVKTCSIECYGFIPNLVHFLGKIYKKNKLYFFWKSCIFWIARVTTFSVSVGLFVPVLRTVWSRGNCRPWCRGPTSNGPEKSGPAFWPISAQNRWLLELIISETNIFKELEFYFINIAKNYFDQKIEILVRNRNFLQKWKLFSKIEFFCKKS